jgi:hypothetical protein
MTTDELKAMLDSLRPWTRRSDFTEADWQDYIRVGRAVQQADPQVVEEALVLTRTDQETSLDYTTQSRPFLLMRVVFDLPESAPPEERAIYKGWTNWPKPDAQGKVSLSWPISWRSGKPELLASYEGSEGKPYGAVPEYRHLRSKYSLRDLRPAPER